MILKEFTNDVLIKRKKLCVKKRLTNKDFGNTKKVYKRKNGTCLKKELEQKKLLEAFEKRQLEEEESVFQYITKWFVTSLYSSLFV